MDMVERSIIAARYRGLVRDWLSTDIGPFYFVASDKGVVYAGWSLGDEFSSFVDMQPNHSDAIHFAKWAKRELSAYFKGELQDFSVPVAADGTEFQHQVWQALTQIPYGATCSYRDIAEIIGRPKAVRAIGQANRSNRTAVIVPCHRVIGANGEMVGYAGSQINLKEFLLGLEQKSFTSASR